MKFEVVKFLARKIMEAGEVPLIWGHFGVGKTDLAREIAKETGRELIILVISQMEPGDLLGLPVRDPKSKRTVFLPPDWWPQTGKSLILIDEMNRAHKSIRNAINQLLVDRRIHNHVLPDGVWIMASANPPDEEYDQVELITDPAFLSRFFHLVMTPNKEEWIKWAERNGIDGKIVNFIEKFPEFLTEFRRVSMKFEPKPSPRSWHKLSKVLSRMSDEEIREYGYVLASSIVGPETARIFIDTIISEFELPSVEEILVDGNESAFRKLKKLDRPTMNSFVLRLNRYIENMDENVDPKRIAENIVKLSDVMPKDVFFSIVRNLKFVADEFNSKTARLILEELSMNPKIVELSTGKIKGWLENI